ncbi:hypothetical protein, partial [Nostoc sp.]
MGNREWAIACAVLSSERSQCHTRLQPEHLPFNQKRSPILYCTLSDLGLPALTLTIREAIAVLFDRAIFLIPHCMPG